MGYEFVIKNFLYFLTCFFFNKNNANLRLSLSHYEYVSEKEIGRRQYEANVHRGISEAAGRGGAGTRSRGVP